MCGMMADLSTLAHHGQTVASSRYYIIEFETVFVSVRNEEMSEDHPPLCAGWPFYLFISPSLPPLFSGRDFQPSPMSEWGSEGDGGGERLKTGLDTEGRLMGNSAEPSSMHHPSMFLVGGDHRREMDGLHSADLSV